MGRLFAYGSLARSGRLNAEWHESMDASSIKDFVGHVMSLAGKKRYLREPAISVILDMVEKVNWIPHSPPWLLASWKENNPANLVICFNPFAFWSNGL